jgi:hypothetical protein
MAARTQVHSFIGDVEVTGGLTKGGAEVGTLTDIPTLSSILNTTNVGVTVQTGTIADVYVSNKTNPATGVDFNFTLVPGVDGVTRFTQSGNDIYYATGNVGIGGAPPANKKLYVDGTVRIGSSDLSYVSSNLNVSTAITANGTILSFTGQHMCTPYGPMSQGLVVSANKNAYTTLNGPLRNGSQAINSSESLPIVSLSSTENDQSVFGIVDHVENSGTERVQDRGGIIIRNTKTLGDDRVIVNSVGEGALWVVNTGGSIVSGDLLTTSNVPGYVQRQDDDIFRSYTVAKITMDCDFNPPDIPVQVVATDVEGRLRWADTNRMEKAYTIRYLDANGMKTDKSNAVHKAAYVGCTYHCG